MTNDFPYIDIAKECIKILKSLEIAYPSNIHEWCSHLNVVGGYLNLYSKYSKPEYYDKLVKFTDIANNYIINWIKTNV